MSLWELLQGLAQLLLVGSALAGDPVSGGCSAAVPLEQRAQMCVPSVSVVQALQLESQVSKELRISTLGSSVTAGAGSSGPTKNWIHLLSTDLKKEAGLQSLRYEVGGFGGYTLKRLLDEKKIEGIIKQNPHVLFVELCLINEHSTSVPVEDTLKYTEEIVEKVKEGLPTTRIILTSSNPTERNQLVNKAGLTYEDYIVKSREWAQQRGWEYVNVYEGMSQIMEREGLSVQEILSDAVHPNDKGYELWSRVLIDYAKNGRRHTP